VKHHPGLLLSQPVANTGLVLGDLIAKTDGSPLRNSIVEAAEKSGLTPEAIGHWLADRWFRTGRKVLDVQDHGFRRGETPETFWPQPADVDLDDVWYQAWNFDPKLWVHAIRRSGEGAPTQVRGVYLMRTKDFPGREGHFLVLASWSAEKPELAGSMFSTMFLPLNDDGTFVNVPESRSSASKLIWVAMMAQTAQRRGPVRVTGSFKWPSKPTTAQKLNCLADGVYVHVAQEDIS
jgi:hypothetical protein